LQKLQNTKKQESHLIIVPVQHVGYAMNSRSVKCKTVVLIKNLL